MRLGSALGKLGRAVRSLWPYPRAALFTVYCLRKRSMCEVLSGNVLRNLVRMR